MLESLLRRWVEFVLDHQILVAGVIIAITLASLSVYPRGILASSIEAMFFGPEHTAYQTYRERARTFSSDETLVVVVDAGNPYIPATLKKLGQAHEAIAELAEVRRVNSVWNLERVALQGDTIAVRRFADDALSGASKPEDLLAETIADPEAGGLLISGEGDAFLLVAELDPTSKRRAEDVPDVVDGIVRGFADAGFAADQVHIGGLSAVHSEIVRQSRLNLLQLFPLVVLVLLIAVYLMFGQFWPVWTNSIAAVIAVVWAMAFSLLRDPYVNILITLVPALVMIISFSDVVHLCSAYLLELEDGKDKRAAVIAASVDVGAACLLTSLTTAVGFISMTFIPTPIFRHLGWVAAFGVFIAYLMAMSLVPILLIRQKTPHNWRDGRNRWWQNRLDALLDGCRRLSTNHTHKVLAVAFVILAVWTYGAAQITFETEFMKRLHPDNEVRQDQAFFENRFAGPSVVEVYIDAASGEDNAVLDPAFFARLVEIENAFEAREEVDMVVSLADLMRATHRSITGADDVDFDTMDDASLHQMMAVLEMQGVDALSPYVDFNRRSVRLTAYVNEPGIRAQYQLSQDMARTAEETLDGDATVLGTGIQPLMGDWVSDIVTGQRQGLLFSLIVIALILIIAFRSIRNGLVTMIPNLMPLLALGGWIGLMWDLVDTDTLIVGMIAIGIGVDDTIHFVSRLRIECEREPDIDTAIRRTFHFSGRGIFMTTFIFTAGFLPLSLSDYLSIHWFGTLLPYCFVVAVLADLLVVPAMAHLGWIRFSASAEASR